MAKEGKSAVVPKLRFPEFQKNGWRLAELNRFAKSVAERVGTTECVPYTVTSGEGLISQQEKLGRTIAGNSIKNYIVLQRDDFAYNKSATKAFPQGFIARYTGTDRAAVPNSIFTCFRANRSVVEPAFLDYLFSSNLHGKWLRTRITVGARAHGSLNVSDDDLLALPVPLPEGPTSLDEQQKIADCLSSLDELIAAQRRKVEALKTYKRGLMQQLFPREGETLPLLRFLNGGDWTEVNLPEVAFFQEGPGIMAVDFCTEGVPLVRLAGVGGSVVTLDGCNYLDPEKVARKWSHFRLTVDDLVISTSATFGLTSLVTDAVEGAVFYTGLIRFRPSTQSLDRGYLKAFLGSPCFERQVESAAVGGGIKHFGPSHIKRMAIPLPSLPEQQRIANCLDALDNLITAETQKSETLKTQKTGLMQQLFPSLEEA